MNTKDKIKYKALSLFSERGFDAVSVRDIAQAVGIKESSLYNHYKSKKEIFDCIVKEYANRGSGFFQGMDMLEEGKSFAADERTIQMYKNMTPEQFEVISLQILEYYLTDEINVKFRKMLTIEQYRSPELKELYRDISFNSSLKFQSQLFAALMQEGVLVKTDPYVLALEFFSPIFLIFYKFDSDKDGMANAKGLLAKHVRLFNERFGTKLK